MTTRTSAPILVLLALLCVVSRVDAWPLLYSAPEIRTRVVDQKTQQPLEGVVVQAQWRLRTELMGGNANYDDRLYEFETVTDRDGAFVLPAWGPRPHSLNSHLTRFVPEYRIFLGGYYPRLLANQRSPSEGESIVRSEWNGKTIELEPFDGDWTRYVRMLRAMWSSGGYGECFRSCPRLVLAVYADWERIKPIVPPDVVRRRGPPPPEFKTLSSEMREFLEQFRGALKQ